MAAEVLNSSSVFQLNFCTKFNICASISATSPSRKTLVARLRNRHPEKKMTIDKIKILKINRHLFDKGTSKKQGIAVLSPKRFDSSFALDAMCGYTPACHADKEKVKNRVEILNLNLSLQNNGYRLDNLTKLKMFSLAFGVFYLLLFSKFITKIYGNF